MSDGPFGLKQSLLNYTDVEFFDQVFAWKKLSVKVKQKIADYSFWKASKYRDVEVLKDVSGFVGCSKLLAIMGPSGAGKTTLLAALAGRLKETVHGEISLNGKIISSKVMLEISGFLPQYDLSFEHYTVLEHLNFMTAMKMDKRLPKTDRLKKIYSITFSLGLTKCHSTFLRNLSGGERKKVSLAVQLLTNPLIIFCDEPVTGLDSYSAYSVVKTLKQLAGTGRIVICTIHQPAAHIFEIFDEVAIIAQGRLAYQGPVIESAEYFSRLGMKCPRNLNIAEFMVEKVSINNLEDQKRINTLCSTFQTSAFSTIIQERMKSFRKVTNSEIITDLENDFGLLSPQRYRATIWTQFWFLLHRRVLHLHRNFREHLMKLFVFMFIGFILSTFYRDCHLNDQKSIRSIQGLIFLAIQQVVFMYSHFEISAETETYITSCEINEQLYRAGPYFFAVTIIKVLYASIEPLLFAAMIYWTTSVFRHVPIVPFGMVFSLSAILAVSYGTCLTYMFRSVNNVLVFTTIYDQLSLSLAGAFIKLSALPVVLQYFKYFSIFYFGTENLSILQWKDVDYIPCNNFNNATCISTGKDVLKTYGYGNDYSYDTTGQLIFIVFLNVMIYYLIQIRSKRCSVY